MDLRSVVQARTTRSGAAFSDFIPIAVDVDLNDLFERAEEAKRQTGFGGHEDSDLESQTGSDHASRCSSPSQGHSSPLTDLSDSEPAGRPEPASGATSRLPGPRMRDGRSSKARKSARQRQKRRAEAGNDSASSKRYRAEIIQNAQEAPVDFDFDSAPVTSTAFTCLRDASEVGIPALQDLKGYKYVDWDGMCVCSRKQPTPY
ncbi:hypothetical protein HDZ31DRAFT_69403 [Schizophyllum fasciatum]